MSFGGTLMIGVETAHSNGMYKISINDTGKGIPQEDLEWVFDPFYTTPEKGIGMGLPLSQKIIEEHGGKVLVSSILNQGTTLTVLLPLAAPAVTGGVDGR
jgi:signal transduction histidine kinase